jgi:hypothetical protein
VGDAGEGVGHEHQPANADFAGGSGEEAGIAGKIRRVRERRIDNDLGI